MQEASGVGHLTAPQASALARLDIAEPLTASEMAGAERVRPQSMAATVAALEELELIRRDRDPDDGRRQLITLTQEGRAWAKGARSHRQEWLVDVLSERLSADERALVGEALSLLERVIDA